MSKKPPILFVLFQYLLKKLRLTETYPLSDPDLSVEEDHRFPITSQTKQRSGNALNYRAMIAASH